MSVVEAYRTCWHAAAYCIGWDLPTDDELVDTAVQALAPIAATLFIECNRGGVKIPKYTPAKQEDESPEPEEDPSEPEDSTPTQADILPF